jgi:sortase A
MAEAAHRALVGKALRRLYRGLFVVGLACLGYCAFSLADSSLYGFVQERRLERALREGPDVSGPSPSFPGAAQRRPPLPVHAGSLIGRIEVPRLALRAVVVEGVEHRTLRRGVGHVPQTAMPGEDGNVALAGHRDTVFRALRQIRRGDVVRIVTPSGLFQYVVESTSVVDPARSDVLDPSGGQRLTLVTCYPFYFVGPAPGRFVVRARLLSGIAAVYARS